MKKTISFVLSLLIALSSVSMLFSCAEDSSAVEGSSHETKRHEEDSIYYERSLVSDGLETVDFGGRPFRVVTQSAPVDPTVSDSVRAGRSTATSALHIPTSLLPAGVRKWAVWAEFS